MTTPTRRSALATLLTLAGCATEDALREADRGIGGTGGIADRGIGGTGIIGTVTAFGSIWVNGRRLELSDATRVTLEGQPVPAATIRLGAVVAALARTGPDNALVPGVIDLRVVVAGPVQRVLPDGGLMILGQRIDLAQAQPAPVPRLGQWLAVAGLRRADGLVVASRLDPWPAARGWLLRGVLEELAPDHALVSGTSVALRQVASTAEPGQEVLVQGGLAARGPVASRLEVQALNPFGAQATTLSLEALLDASGLPPAQLAGLLRGQSGTPGERILLEGRPVDATGGLEQVRTGPAPGIGERGAPPTAPPPGNHGGFGGAPDARPGGPTGSGPSTGLGARGGALGAPPPPLGGIRGGGGGGRR